MLRRSLHLLLSAVLVARAATIAAGQQFNETGPYTIDSYTVSNVLLPLPDNKTVTVPVKLTFPTSGDGPFPLIIMFNGFECNADWYTDTVTRVASWGYVVVQYTNNITTFLTTSDRTELAYLQPLLDWLATQTAATSGSRVAGKVDLTRKAVMGHSRGGKLAALHYAGRTDLLTAVLLDPVDCPPVTTLPLDQFPRGAAALAGLDIICRNGIPPHPRSNKKAAIVAAGYSSSCNPIDFNYQGFADSLAPGSWQAVVLKAGHMQFASSWNPLYGAIDTGCGPLIRTISTPATIEKARTVAVAWFEQFFRPSESVERLQVFLNDWVPARAVSMSFQTLGDSTTSGAAQRGGAASAADPAGEKSEL